MSEYSAEYARLEAESQVRLSALQAERLGLSVASSVALNKLETTKVDDGWWFFVSLMVGWLTLLGALIAVVAAK